MMNPGDLGKVLVAVGGLLVLTGLALVALGRLPFLGRLPGDIAVRRGGFSCFVPLASSLLLSLLLTIVLNVILRLLAR
jgi:hypothetical protein